MAFFKIAFKKSREWQRVAPTNGQWKNDISLHQVLCINIVGKTKLPLVFVTIDNELGLTKLVSRILDTKREVI